MWFIKGTAEHAEHEQIGSSWRPSGRMKVPARPFGSISSDLLTIGMQLVDNFGV